MDLLQARQGLAALRRSVDLWLLSSTPSTSLPEYLISGFAALDATLQELQVADAAFSLVEVLENERRTIARELHDEAGQSVTAIQLGLSAIERHAGQPEIVLARVHDLQQIANDVMDGLHRLAMNLRPASLDRYGLLPGLSQFIESFERQAQLRVELVQTGLDDRRLPAAIESALYRIIQEALTNVARHAHAAHVSVILERRDQHLLAIVEDDGGGFDVEEAMCCGRLGLIGIRERAEMLHGTLTIESAPGKGTTVYVEVPLSAQES
jgi:signal transduction histidine kinase